MTNPQELTAAMERLLSQMLPSARRISVSDCVQITGGYSRIMRRISASVDGETRHYVVRSDPAPGAAAVETDRDQEWALVAALTAAGAPVPSALYYDAAGAALGTRSMVLEFIEGPSLLAASRKRDANDLASSAGTLCEMAAAVHRVPVGQLPPQLLRPPSWDAYIDSCIQAWRDAEAEHSESMPLFRHLAAWLARNKPAPAPLSLVHGEFQPSNIMAGGAQQPSVVVDWEFAHIGDPREDLGWSRFMGATVQPPDLIGIDEAGFCRRYRELSGLSDEVINPQTIAYFTILPMGRQLAPLLRAVKLFEQGVVSSLGAAYMGLGFLSTAQDTYIKTTQALDALRLPKESAA